MEQTKLCTVTVGETARAYPYGTTYQTIAADFQEQYENDILLVSRNGKLCELNKTLDRDCTLDIITAKDKPGIQTYRYGYSLRGNLLRYGRNYRLLHRPAHQVSKRCPCV